MPCCDCSRPFVALSVISLLRSDSIAFGCEADTRTVDRSNQSDVNDPACVKTHTSAKCRKHNSPARHRTSRVQYDLTLRDAIARRYFFVWRDRWSFRTAKTQTGHRFLAGSRYFVIIRRGGVVGVGVGGEIVNVTQVFQPWGRFSAANSE